MDSELPIKMIENPVINYCTLFNSHYLSKGLAMYRSLKAHSVNTFHLYIYAFDEITADIITGMKLPSITVVRLDEFETGELLGVKNERTLAEYCWTCTPSVLAHSINCFNLRECTYLDADIFFYSDPAVLIEEMHNNKKSVLITEHRFSFIPRIFEIKRAGRFCVQFLTIVNEPEALQVLDRWRKQCIDWCYARYEDGKFGDQKYLEEWPSLYENIHILEHEGGGLAPWNITRYRFKVDTGNMTTKPLINRRHFNPVFYHFQYVRRINEDTFDLGWFFLPPKVKKYFYKPYIRGLKDIEFTLQKLNEEYNINFTDYSGKSFRERIKSMLKGVFKYNIITVNS